VCDDVKFFYFFLQVLTKDSVTVSVDAVVYYRVSNATVSVANVENAHHSTRLLAQTTLRNVLGTKNLSEILSERESIANSMQVYHSVTIFRYKTSTNLSIIGFLQVDERTKIKLRGVKTYSFHLLARKWTPYTQIQHTKAM
jgi:SPFH domain / Band 7 family